MEIFPFFLFSAEKNYKKRKHITKNGSKNVYQLPANGLNTAFFFFVDEVLNCIFYAYKLA